MTVKTEVEEVDKHTVVVTIEVSADQIAGPISKTYREIAKKVRIPGFRKGKAPKPIIDQMVGRDVVLDEAANDIIPDVYTEAVKAAGVVPVTMPEIDVVQIKIDEPFIFTAKVQVKPEAKLGSLDDLEVEQVEPPSLSEGVKTEIERLRNKFATLEVAKSRQSRNGDFVLIDYEGFIADKPFEGGRGSDYMLELGSSTFIPGFEEQLLDLKPGASKDVKLTFPSDYQSESLAGAEAVFKVEIKEIKTRKLPKVDDEFAMSASKFDTLKELKDDLKEKVKEKQEKEQKSALREAALEKMVDLAEVELPDGMLQRRMEQMVGSFANQVEQTQGIKFSEWLSQTGMTPQAFQDNYKEEASRNLKTELTLEAVARDFELDATEEEITKEIERLAEGSDKDPEELRKEIEERDGNEFLQERLSMDKAIEFLADSAKVKLSAEVKIEKKTDKKKEDADDPNTDSD